MDYGSICVTLQNLAAIKSREKGGSQRYDTVSRIISIFSKILTMTDFSSYHLTDFAK